jgi:hypothetical protein
MLRKYKFISTANVVFSVFLLIAISLSLLGYVSAAAPNPGHNFSEISGGVLQGDILYGTSTDLLAALPKNTSATRYLSNTGLNNNPAWAQVNLSSGVTSTLPGINGGTGNSFMNFAGPATSTRTFTLPNASATILTDFVDVTVAQGGTGTSTLTANNVILGNGASSVLFVAPLGDGSILQSNGTSWITASGGVLIGRQTLTASGTYTPTAGTKKILVRMWGGGGAGGGCSGVAAGCAGGGGGSGGYAEYYFSGVTSTNPYTIGAGGKGVSGAAGQAASNTTFTIGGTTVTAFGGSGGSFTAGSAAIKFMVGGAGGVISTNGNVNAAGVPGGTGMTSTVNTVVASGEGGSTSLGGGGLPRVNVTSAGSNAIANTGSGGSGASAVAATANIGGNGADGLIIVTEYR